MHVVNSACIITGGVLRAIKRAALLHDRVVHDAEWLLSRLPEELTANGNLPKVSYACVPLKQCRIRSRSRPALGLKHSTMSSSVFEKRLLIGKKKSGYTK